LRTPRGVDSIRVRLPFIRWIGIGLVGVLVCAVAAVAALRSWPTTARALGGESHLRLQSVTVQKVCPGFLNIAGYGSASLVNTNWNTPTDLAKPVKVEGGNKVIVDLKGRTYLSNRCSPGHFDNTEYAAVRLLGKRLRYTVDLSKIGCGCNAALYLTAQRYNSNVSLCGDYYCDAMRVCGIACNEIDIQEANTRAWASTVHLPDDGSGVSVGYGGGDSNFTGRRDWDANQYGPGGTCIDTIAAPVDVTVGFPMARNGTFMGMVITLGQASHSCELSAKIDRYPVDGQDAMYRFAEVLKEGMTPVISYWSSKEMLWLDGRGSDGQGPCAEDWPGSCAESVAFSDFSIEALPEPAPTPQPWELEPSTPELVVPERQYMVINIGGCTDHRLYPIHDQAHCEEAAASLFLPDTTADRVSDTAVTEGCFFVRSDSTLRFATDPSNRGNGADGNRHQICVDQATDEIVFSSATTTSPSSPSAGLFDCSKDLSTWRENWTMSKALWCCQHERLGCLPAWYGGRVPVVNQ
jgi:hypothetical protein